jgi:hypothetical protein
MKNCPSGESMRYLQIVDSLLFLVVPNLCCRKALLLILEYKITLKMHLHTFFCI